VYSAWIHYQYCAYIDRSSWQTYSSLLLVLGLAALECLEVTLALETLGGDEALNARSLGVWLGSLLLGLDFAANNELADL
jgi:hypothetical protein